MTILMHSIYVLTKRPVSFDEASLSKDSNLVSIHRYRTTAQWRTIIQQLQKIHPNPEKIYLITCYDTAAGEITESTLEGAIWALTNS